MTQRPGLWRRQKPQADLMFLVQRVARRLRIHELDGIDRRLRRQLTTHLARECLAGVRQLRGIRRWRLDLERASHRAAARQHARRMRRHRSRDLPRRAHRSRLARAPHVRQLRAFGNHPDCGRHSDQSRQPLSAAGTRDQPELDFRQTDLRGRHGNAVMATHRNLETAAERLAVDRRDGWLWRGLQPLDHVTEKRRQQRLAELLDVRARKKGLARADDDERMQLTISREPIERGDQTGTHGLRQRVDGRMIDGRETDAAVNGESDGFGHGTPTSSEHISQES